MAVSKMYSSPDCSRFYAFGRVMSGTLHTGDRVRVLGEHYSVFDEEDMSVETVADLWIFQARYRISVSRVTAGSLVLIGGIGTCIVKTATVVRYRFCVCCAVGCWMFIYTLTQRRARRAALCLSPSPL